MHTDLFLFNVNMLLKINLVWALLFIATPLFNTTSIIIFVWWIFLFACNNLNLFITKENEKNNLVKNIWSSLLNIFDLYLDFRISEDLNLLFEKNPKRNPNQPGLKVK